MGKVRHDCSKRGRDVAVGRGRDVAVVRLTDVRVEVCDGIVAEKGTTAVIEEDVDCDCRLSSW